MPLGWALYDFANTIFSYAVVSYAIGLWLVDDARFGEGDGNLAFSVAIATSVALNALVSPILGALSDRGGGRRLPFLLFFTLLCIVPTALIGGSPPIVGLVLFAVANFAYQAALIYYDATLKTVSHPETRGKLSGIGVAIGYCGTIFIGILIFLLDLPVPSIFLVAAALFGLFAIPLFLVVKEGGAAGRLTRTDITGSWSPAPDDDRARPGGPRPRALPPRPVLLLRRGQHDHRRHGDRRDRGDGPLEDRRQPDPALAGRRGGARELRLGRARRPARAETDPADRPGIVGRSGWSSVRSRSASRAPSGSSCS